MADARLWARIDVGYFDNAKISDALDASSNAVTMHLASILHSAQHLTDGHVSPRTMQRKVGGTQQDTDILIELGLWHAENHDCPHCPQPEPGRVYVHNFLEHNRSRAKAEEASSRAKDAAKARWKPAENRENKPDDATRNAPSMQDAMQSRESRESREEEEGPRGPHLLPSDFAPSADMRTWASKNTPAVDVTLATSEFIDYWTRERKRKKDWPATWRNHMKRQQGFAERNGWRPPNAAPRITGRMDF